MQTSATLEPAAPTCMVAPPISLSRATKTEWQYSYSPSGEREIKRLVRSPKTDSTCGSVYPWTYYLLGTNDEQQVVYHGRQLSRADCDAGGIGRRVFFYPVEYRSYGVDGVNIVWERDVNGALVSRFVGTDVQGSERYVVGKNAYEKVRDYLPFGVDVAVANDQRRGYLGKESDYETAPKYGVVHAGLYHERLMDMSARKYSKTQGAFTSVDALWDMAIETSPYIYTHHDPINFMDPSGYGEITHGGGSGGVTSGGSMGGAWPSNWIMLDAYSSDEAAAIVFGKALETTQWRVERTEGERLSSLSNEVGWGAKNHPRAAGIFGFGDAQPIQKLHEQQGGGGGGGGGGGFSIPVSFRDLFRDRTPSSYPRVIPRGGGGVPVQVPVERRTESGTSGRGTVSAPGHWSAQVFRPAGQGYNSFSAFKRAEGPAGPGQAWHHIVEQTPSNLTKFGSQAIHNTNNLVRLPHGPGTIHNRISGHYSSIQRFTNGQTVRQWLSGKSYLEQYNYGIQLLKQNGWEP